MKEVTVYKLAEERVLLGNHQDAYDYYYLPEVPHRVLGAADDWVLRSETFDIIRLPIRYYRKVNGDNIYVAFDNAVMELLSIEEEKVAEILAEKQKKINVLVGDIERIKNMSWWETAKVAWSKLWNS